MINGFTKVIGEAGLNIENLTNKARGEFAYTIIDLENPINDETLQKLREVEGVTRVRVVK